MHVTRFTKLRGFNNIIGGRDLGGVFEEGRVYAAVKIDGIIIIQDIGEASEYPGWTKNGKFSQVMMSSEYIITKEESIALKKREEEEE